MKHKAFIAGAVFISILSFIPGSQLPAEPFDAADLVVHFGMYFFGWRLSQLYLLG